MCGKNRNHYLSCLCTLQWPIVVDTHVSMNLFNPIQLQGFTEPSSRPTFWVDNVGQKNTYPLAPHSRNNVLQMPPAGSQLSGLSSPNKKVPNMLYFTCISIDSYVAWHDILFFYNKKNVRRAYANLFGITFPFRRVLVEFLCSSRSSDICG